MPDIPCIPCMPCMPCIGCEPYIPDMPDIPAGPMERDPAAGTRAAGCAARAAGCAARRQSWSVPVQVPAPVAPGLARHSRRSRAPRSPPALRPRARSRTRPARRHHTRAGRPPRVHNRAPDRTRRSRVPRHNRSPAVAHRSRGRQVVVVVTLLVPHPLARTHHVAEVEGAGVGGKAHRCGKQACGQQGARRGVIFFIGCSIAPGGCVEAGPTSPASLSLACRPARAMRDKRCRDCLPLRVVKEPAPPCGLVRDMAGIKYG